MTNSLIRLAAELTRQLTAADGQWELITKMVKKRLRLAVSVRRKGAFFLAISQSIFGNVLLSSFFFIFVGGPSEISSFSHRRKFAYFASRQIFFVGERQDTKKNERKSDTIRTTAQLNLCKKHRCVIEWWMREEGSRERKRKKTIFCKM
jgi:hypothetical protein